MWFLIKLLFFSPFNYSCCLITENVYLLFLFPLTLVSLKVVLLKDHCKKALKIAMKMYVHGLETFYLPLHSRYAS